MQRLTSVKNTCCCQEKKLTQHNLCRKCMSFAMSSVCAYVSMCARSLLHVCMWMFVCVFVFIIVCVFVDVFVFVILSVHDGKMQTNHAHANTMQICYTFSNSERAVTLIWKSFRPSAPRAVDSYVAEIKPGFHAHAYSQINKHYYAGGACIPWRSQ